MSDENSRAREDAIGKYKILGVVQFLLGGGLFTLGIMGAVYEQSEDDDGYSGGMPYFLGGFTVGSLQLFSALMSGCVVYKAEGGHDTDVKRRQIGCCMHGHYILAMLCIMLGFMGLVFAGVFGVNYGTYGDAEEDNQKHKNVAYGLIALLVLSLVVVFFTMYLVCSNGRYFGIVLQRGQRRGVAVILDANTAARLHAMNSGMNADSNATALQLEQLRTQNLLLQQQILTQQQQQQQQQQPFGGQYPPPPPSYSSVVDPAYPPNPSFPSAPPFGKAA